AFRVASRLIDRARGDRIPVRLRRQRGRRRPARRRSHRTGKIRDSMPESTTRTYAVAMAACWPIVSRWGRLDVSGLEHLPADGPVLLAGNHDSYWDPVAVGVA